MAPASHAAVPADLTAHADSTPHGAIPVPRPGSTALLIHDCRELFKVRVTGMVVVTGWAGFYLGSMQSGISSVQRGLLDTLFGIGLVSAGAGALNQALERKTDALHDSHRRTGPSRRGAFRWQRAYWPASRPSRWAAVGC